MIKSSWLAQPSMRLFLTSALILFTELLLLRWIPSRVISIGFFSNFLLIGCFLGIGVGILLGRKGARLPGFVFPFVLFLVVAFISKNQLNLALESKEEIVFGAGKAGALTGVVVLPVAVLLTTLVMAVLAHPLGPLLKSMPPLRAYAIDIAGSLAGIACFVALSAGWTTPREWFLVVAGFLVLLELGSGLRVWSIAGAAALAGVLLFAGEPPPRGTIERWSPYYRVTVYPHGAGTFSINVNGIPHQVFGPLTQVRLAPTAFEQVYHWFEGRRFRRALIVGAGSGTDVAVALANGVEHVDAVEIDPLIASIGVELNPERPYQDARVTRVIDDGRSFLRRTHETYDLVIFAATDSMAVAAGTNIRVESFLFTREAFQEVRARLAPDGVFVCDNMYWQGWLVDRLAAMMEETFGVKPIVRDGLGQHVAVLATGPAVAAMKRPPGCEPRVVADPPCATTDDWPFPYLRSPGIPEHYMAALAAILALSTLVVFGTARATGVALAGGPHFFALGTAFLLLETRSLVSFGLLFGTTWIVNALAFFAILTSVLLAIGVNAVVRFERPRLLYLALAAALGVAFLVSPGSLLLDPPWLRYALASAIAFAPIFVANLIFAHSFKDTETADTAFAANLLGAALGGALEYLSLLTGFRALLLVVGALYAIAFVLRPRTSGSSAVGTPGATTT